MAVCSDQEVEIACDPCKYEERSVEAKGYCVECGEHLCRDCELQHKRFQLTRQHSIAPVEAGSAARTGVTESCPQHRDRRIEYYCEDHQQLSCPLCLTVGHQKCQYVTCIADVAEGIGEGTDFQQATRQINELVTGFKKLSEGKLKQIEEVGNQKSKAVQDIMDLRKKIDDMLDHLQDEVLFQAEDLHKSLAKERTTDLEMYRSVISSLQDAEDILQRTRCRAGEEQLFIALKRTTMKIREHEALLSDCSITQDEPCLKFHVNRDFIRRFQELSSFGDVKNMEQTRKSVVSSEHRAKSIRAMSAVPAGGHAIRTADDKTTCCVTGALFLDDGRLLLADYSNRSIKLFDQMCNFLKRVVLSSRPTGLTKARQNEVATCLMDETAIQFHQVDSSIQKSHLIKTEMKYSGIACSDTDIFGTCSTRCGQGEIHVLDYHGNMQRIIGNSRVYSLFFVKPQGIQLNRANNRLYVLDTGKNCLFCLDLNGRVIFTYNDRNLATPTSLTLDTEGNVYVSSGTNSVHQVTSLGTKVQEVVGQQDGINEPHCVCYCPHNRRLLVAEFKENSVKFFRLV